MIQWLKKHWEVLSYLIFGVLTTLLNILLYALFNRLFGYTAANSWGNVLDNILCILFAYATNRAFVFRSKTRGREQAKEFTAFVSCRLGTLLLDTPPSCRFWATCWRPGARRLMDSLMSGLLTHAFHWFGPDTTVQMASELIWARLRASRTAPRPLPSSAGPTGPTAIFVTSRIRGPGAVGACAVKVFSNVVVVDAELCVQQAHRF